jgi:hypothetical protein
VIGDRGVTLAVAAVATSDGGTALVGRTSGDAEVAGTVLKADRGDDHFVLKLDPSGRPTWAMGVEGRMLSSTCPLAATADGAVVVASFLETPRGRHNGDYGPVYLSETAANGKPTWRKELGGQYEDSPVLAASPDGFYFAAVGDRLGKAMELGGAPIESAGAMRAGLARFDRTGTHLWSKGLPAGASIEDLAAASPDGLVLTGMQSADEMDLGGGPLVKKGPWGGTFVAKYSQQGDHLWSGAFEAELVGRRIAATPNGGAVAVGTFLDHVAIAGRTIRTSGEVDTMVLALWQ